MHLLVVIAGPIGAGKSTVADRLGRRLAERGRTAAVVDLDDVAFMQRGIAPSELWRRAAIAAGALVGGWFEAGTEAVVAHGPFFESSGYDVLLGSLGTDVSVQHVLLRVSYDTALARVSGDAARGMSKDPDFLKRTHLRFRDLEASLPVPDFVFDTELLDADAIAASVVARLAP